MGKIDRSDTNEGEASVENWPNSSDVEEIGNGRLPAEPTKEKDCFSEPSKSNNIGVAFKSYIEYEKNFNAEESKEGNPNDPPEVNVNKNEQSKVTVVSKSDIDNLVSVNDPGFEKLPKHSNNEQNNLKITLFNLLFN